MAYNAWVTAAGQSEFASLREEMRLRLAQRLLSRTGVHGDGRGSLYLDVDDLPSAGLFELLGDFWAWYGWRERRQLARSKDFDLALATAILQGVGHDLSPVGGQSSHLALDADLYRYGLTPYDERRAALERSRAAQSQKAPCLASQ